MPIALFPQAEENFLIENINKLSEQNPSWKKLEEKISEEKKLALINSVLALDSSSYCYADHKKDNKDFFDFYRKAFHFIDLDSDSDIDIVFSGAPCAEDYPSVIIYINDQNNLNKISVAGKIVSMQKSISVIIHEKACCGRTPNILRYYRIAKNDIVLSSSILFHRSSLKCEGPVIPAKLKAIGRVEIKENAEIKFSAQDSVRCGMDLIKSNTMAITVKKTSAEKFASVVINGSTWNFVKLREEDVIQSPTLPRETVVGWVKGTN